MSAVFDLTVPIYIRGLEQLSHVLKLGEQWSDERHIPHESLLEAKLAPEMKPLIFQVQAASNTAKGILPRVAGLPNLPMEDNQSTFAQLQERIQQTVEILRTVKPEDLEGNKNAEVVLSFRRELRFPTPMTYLQVYGIPNFWFHVCMVYANLRSQGVPVGKIDFIGADYVSVEP